MKIKEILDKLDNLENTKLFYDYLGDLLWQSSLTNYELLDKFLNREAKEMQEIDLLELQYTNKQEFYEWLRSELWSFYKSEYVLFAKLLIKELDSFALVDLLIQIKEPKQVIYEAFQKRLTNIWLKKIGE